MPRPAPRVAPATKATLPCSDVPMARTLAATTECRGLRSPKLDRRSARPSCSSSSKVSPWTRSPAFKVGSLSGRRIAVSCARGRAFVATMKRRGHLRPLRLGEDAVKTDALSFSRLAGTRRRYRPVLARRGRHRPHARGRPHAPPAQHRSSLRAQAVARRDVRRRRRGADCSGALPAPGRVEATFRSADGREVTVQPCGAAAENGSRAKGDDARAVHRVPKYASPRAPSSYREASMRWPRRSSFRLIST